VTITPHSKADPAQTPILPTPVTGEALPGGTVLVVDDEAADAQRIEEALSRVGYRILRAGTGTEAFRALADERVALVLVDLQLPDMDGMEVLRRALEADQRIEVIVMTAHGSIEQAVQAMQEGAADYLTKPIDLADLRARVDRAIRSCSLAEEIRYLRDEVNRRYGVQPLLGHSRAMEQVYELIRQVAPTNATVLITGESGTGKELTARALHFLSRRRDKPFLPINGAAFAESLLESELFGHERGAFTGATERRIGKLELAQGGTLFLDEIAEVSRAVQVKLLRVLEQREFMRVGGSQTIRIDVRLVTATNADLEQLVASKRFREDLYYRLKVITIPLPPLRDRREDIPLLVQAFLQQFAAETGKVIRGIREEALEVLVRYRWPGNVRELRNVVESMVVLARRPELTLADVPAAVRAAAGLPPRLALPAGAPGSPAARGAEGAEPAASPSLPAGVSRPTPPAAGVVGAAAGVGVGASEAPIAAGDGRALDLSVGMTMAEIEREAIRRTLEWAGGNKTKAARILHMGLRTLQRKLKQFESWSH
jgi:two-component system response regulator PilR (NtrC family)/two-component system response regulator HydG